MGKTPLVSVILPVYNGEKYLSESINSILTQSYKNIELIIVDDGSTDATNNIIESYKKRDERIKCVKNQDNLKLPKSLNVGFSYAKGDYLSWTSDDNLFLTDAVEDMVDYLSSNQEDVMVCAALKFIDENGKIVSEKYSYDNEYIYYRNVLGACFLYRREVLKEIGQYNSDMFLVEDYEYWLRILHKYERIGFLDKVLYLYRKHSRSLTSKRIEDVKRQLLKLRDVYFEDIINHLVNRPEYLTSIYFDFLVWGEDKYKNIMERLREIYPCLNYVQKLNDENHLIAYGAGDYGSKAYSTIGDRIDFFVDRNAINIHIKCGKKVIAPHDINNYLNGRNVVITVAPENAYRIIKCLVDTGIEHILIDDWEYFEKLTIGMEDRDVI